MESNTSSYCMLQKLDYFSSVGLLGLVYKTVNWNCSWWGELTVLLYSNSCNNWFWLIFHLLPQSVQWRLCFSRKCENSLSRLVDCQIHQPNALHSNERVHVALHYIASCDNRQQRTAQCHTVQFNIVVIHYFVDEITSCFCHHPNDFNSVTLSWQLFFSILLPLQHHNCDY